MNQAQANVKTILPRTVYKHYKGNLYEIVCRAWISEHEKLVRAIVYKGLYTDSKLGENPIFVQTEERFLQPITINGKKINRFKLLFD